MIAHPRIAAAVLMIALAGCRNGTAPAPVASAPPQDPSTAESPQATPQEVPRTTVSVYFPSASGTGLVAERREIFVTPAPGDRIKQIVADLLSGPTDDRALPALPPGTRLRQAYVIEGGVAYLDFSSELTGIGGGSTVELLTVYAIVDSVVANVPEIKKVGLLVDGAPIETLNGHMDLRRPIPPDRSLILPVEI